MSEQDQTIDILRAAFERERAAKREVLTALRRLHDECIFVKPSECLMAEIVIRRHWSNAFERGER